MEWLSAGIGSAVCHGEVVRIAIWCLQNPNDRKVAEWDDLKAVVLSLCGYAHINFVATICLLGGSQSQFERRTRAWECLNIRCEYVDGPDPTHFTSQGDRTILKTHKARFGRFYNNK